MKHRPPNRQRRRQVQVRASPTTSTDASKPEAIEAPVPESPALTEVSRPTTIPWMPVLYVSSLIFFCAWYMAPSLFRSWFFSSDEYVIVAEIIRFLHLDFRQHFFDMPGTPLMFVSALLWLLIYAFGFVTGLIPKTAGLETFTFGHLPLLFILVRAITLLCALVSIGLVFVLASKVMNRAGAAVAALIVMMSPTYTSYSSFIRVESMAMCLMLGSILIVLRAIRGAPARGRVGWDIRWILLSGVLAGLAAACRFHSITASVPVLLLLLTIADRKPPAYPRTLVLAWDVILGLGLFSAAAFAIGIKIGYVPRSRLGRDLLGAWPVAFEKLYPLSIIAAIGLAGVCCLRLIAWKRPSSDRYTHPRILVLAFGCCVGCLVGTPTLLWQYQYFLQSIASYSSGYFDLDRAGWPLLKNIEWLLKLYLRLIAPDNLTLFLMLCGAGLILIRKDRVLIPFLAGAALFFVSRPITLIAASHHCILWLPMYAILAGYAVANGYDALQHAGRHAKWIAGAGLAALFIALGYRMSPGPVSVRANSRFTEERMHGIQSATDWVHSNTEPNAVVAISYYCFNSNIFYTWLQQLEVPEPASVWDGRRYLIWWGQHAAVQGLKGYAIAMPQDIQAMKERIDQVSPGQGTDPYHDKGFQRIEAFGTYPNEVDVFRFDFTDSKRLP